MESIENIGGSIQSMLRIIQNNQNVMNKSADFMKFVDERGFRPGLRIAQNIHEELSSFHKKSLSIMQFGFKSAMDLLSRILEMLKEILSRIRPSKSVGDNTLERGSSINTEKSVAKSGTSNSISNMVQSITNNISITATVMAAEKSNEGMLSKILGKIGGTFFDSLLKNTIGKIIDKYIENTLGKVFEKLADKLFIKALGEFFDRLANKLFPGGSKNSGSGTGSSGIPQSGSKGGSSLGSGGKSGMSSVINSFRSAGSAAFSALSRSAGSVLKLFGSISSAVSRLNIGYQLMRVATLGASAAQSVLNSVFLANPIGAIITGVIVLIGLIALLVQNWNAVKGAIGGVWNDIVSIFGNIGGWLQNHVINPVSSIVPGWLKKFFGAGGGTSSKGGGGSAGGGGSSAGYRSGLAYVPYDGFIAELHQGERVLTASENKAYGNTGRAYNNTPSNGGNTFNITINGVNKSTNEIINEIVSKIKETAGTMGEVAYSL